MLTPHNIGKTLASSVIPLSFLIISKIISIFTLHTVLNIRWGLYKSVEELNIFSVQIVYPNFQNAYIITTYSNIVMISIMILGTLIKYAQLKHLSTSTISPQNVVRLAQGNMIGVVKSVKDIRHETITWLIFGWIGIIFNIFTTIVGLSNIYFTIVVFFIQIFLSVAIIDDELEEPRYTS